jgi:hypothetical protein
LIVVASAVTQPLVMALVVALKNLPQTAWALKNVPQMAWAEGSSQLGKELE